jgi:hypothetical protein
VVDIAKSAVQPMKNRVLPFVEVRQDVPDLLFGLLSSPVLSNLSVEVDHYLT